MATDSYENIKKIYNLMRSIRGKKIPLDNMLLVDTLGYNDVFIAKPNYDTGQYFYSRASHYDIELSENNNQFYYIVNTTVDYSNL